MMPDLAVELLMPPLMEKITKLAPNVRIDVVPWRGPAIFTAEFARTIDLVISIGNAFKGFHRQRLYTDSDALAVRRGHPVGARLKRREAFLDARHVAVVIRGQSEDLIDGWLRPKGIERRIALVVPGYIEALHVTARTDLVAFVPRRLIGALSKQLSLVTITPPFDPGIDEQFMFYPTRAQMDPGSIWLRNIMLGIGREMERERAARPRKRSRRVGKGASAVPTICRMTMVHGWWARFALPTLRETKSSAPSLPPAPSSPPGAPTSACGERRPSEACEIDAVALEPERDRVTDRDRRPCTARPSPTAPSACRARSARSCGHGFRHLGFMSANEDSSAAQR